MEYCNFCANPKTRTIVDCRKCKQVYVDINPHEMKCIDDQKEEFQAGVSGVRCSECFGCFKNW